MDETNNNVLFISHSASDRPFAVALERAIYDLVGSDSLIDVRYSTSEETGPQGGEQWREWIYLQVVTARTSLIVVTPQSIGKPWLLWEAGACRGASLAQALDGDGASIDDGSLGSRMIATIAYGLSETECPDPLRGDQIVLGTNPDRMEQHLLRVLETHGLPANLVYKAGKRMEEVLSGYLEAVDRALLESSSLITEANVQEWLSRLDDLIDDASSREGHISVAELRDFERWMSLAFGRDEGTGITSGAPIDVRLHRRLGQLYLEQTDLAGAVTQLELARRAAPRDIYVLRPLGEARLKGFQSSEGQEPDGDAEEQAKREMKSLLAAIEDLDDRAFIASADTAALYGNYLRRVEQNLEGAIEIYARALDRNQESYYLADLMAQTQLAVGRLDDARVTYRRALDIIEADTGRGDIWSHATAATARLALGEYEAVEAELESMLLLRPSPTPNQIASIKKGLGGVATDTDCPDAEWQKFTTLLERHDS